MSAKELAKEWLAGLEGMTVEPWCVEDGDVWSADDEGRRGIPLLRQDASRHFRTWGRIVSNDEMAAMVAFVARCSPDNIRTLASALLAETDRADALEKRCGMAVTVGGGLSVYGTFEAINRVQDFIMLDSTHPVEKEDVRRSLARSLQTAEARADSLAADLERVKGLKRFKMATWRDIDDVCDITDMVEASHGSWVRYSEVIRASTEKAAPSTGTELKP